MSELQFALSSILLFLAAAWLLYQFAKGGP